MPNKLDNSEDQARHISSCNRMQLLCSPACTLTSPTKTSTSSEPAWSKWTMMELFMADRHQHLPAATMLHVLDSTMLRLSRTSPCGRTASSRRAAAAARRSARGPHAPRPGSRARTARRHERSERRDPPASAIARNLIIFSYLPEIYASITDLFAQPLSPPRGLSRWPRVAWLAGVHGEEGTAATEQESSFAPRAE